MFPSDNLDLAITEAGKHKFALVIGVNNSKHSSWLETLKYAEEDAYDVHRSLRRDVSGFTCVAPALTGEKAATGNVRSAVISLVTKKENKDFLLFYFIGHAQPLKRKDGRSDIYFVTHDFNQNEVKIDPSSHLSMSWLRNILYQSDGAGKILIILDCCYAGNMIETQPDSAHIHMDTNVRQIVEECLGSPSATYHMGRLRVILTATGYNKPAQERRMTPLVLSALQGTVQEAADHKGYVNIHSLYMYLQTQMPQEQLPNLAGDFPQTCILAYHPHFSDEHHSEALQAERDSLRVEVSKLSDRLSEVHSFITDPQFFERIASPSAQSLPEYFDYQIAKNASFDDLHLEKITEFFKRDLVQRQEDFYLEVSSQDQLRHFGLLRELCPTYGALLCFGLNLTQWHPGASTRCTLWSGNDRDNGWIDVQDYQRDLIAQFESSRNFIQKHLHLTRKIGRDERSEKLEIPLSALGEALANALMHREYMNQTTSIYVDIFNNRIEISNPGILPEPMTLELLEEEHKSHPRNPQIARIFYLHQYVEKVGSGIRRMQRALRSAGLEPAKFEISKDKIFKVTFYRPKQVPEEVISRLTSKREHPVNVLYSYAHADEHWHQQLTIYLSLMHRQGLISTWYDRQITAGTDWTQAIDVHLNSASVILLLISPNFFASDYCYGIEVQRALERHQANEARVIPILLSPVEWQVASFAHLQALPTNAKPVTSWSNQDEAFADIAAGIRRAIEDLTSAFANLPRATSLPLVWNIPYQRNDYFTGREEILELLHARFQTGHATALSQRQAMSGLGGIGKTQIAVEYAHRYHQEYQAILWTRAENQETLMSSFVEIAAFLNLPQKDAQDQTIPIQAVMDWLRSNRKWLLILDNADTPAIVREFLPTKCDGHILLTTRAQALGGLAQRLEIDTFTPELGALFLLRRASLIALDAVLEKASSNDREVAMQISQQLGGLPLALDQAGAYMEETGCRLQDYHRIYQQRQTELLKERRGLVEDHPEPVATTWSLSFAQVEEKNPAAAELLRFCAFLAPEDIAVEMIIQGAPHLGSLLEPLASDPYELNQAIEVLSAYSLVQRDSSTGTLSIHRLVQAVLRDAIPAEVAKLWAERTVCAVNAAFPEVEFTQWPACERYLPHVLMCAEQIEQWNITLLDVASLFHRVGWYLDDRARYSEAKPLYQRALAIREQQLGPEHPDTAQSLNSLASLYDNQGKYEQAEPLLKRSLAIREQQLGPEHPDTAQSLNSLASLYDNQGKYEQAEPLLKRSLAIREQQLGPEHPDTAQSLNSLASLYDNQGKYEQAEPLLKRSLAIREQQLGPEHPDTANSLNNLAGLYQAQGKYEQAEPLLKRSLAIREQQLGPEHPDTANSLNNLAGLYRAQGKYEQAEPLLKRSLAIDEKALGPQHPEVATNLNNLAALYDDQGKYEQAEPLLKRSLAIREQQLGPEHPDTAQSLNNLAGLYRAQVKYEQAEPLLKRSLAIREQQLGPEHPDTAQSLNNLAGLYDTLGKYEQAEPLYQRALAIRERQLGPEHPDTAQSLNNLAGLYDTLGKYEQAEPLYQRALAIYEQQLGSEHPDTQVIRSNYIFLLQAMGREDEAKQMENGNDV